MSYSREMLVGELGRMKETLERILSSPNPYAKELYPSFKWMQSRFCNQGQHWYAWFKDWPESATDSAEFLAQARVEDPLPSDLHRSELHGWCILCGVLMQPYNFRTQKCACRKEKGITCYFHLNQKEKDKV